MRFCLRLRLLLVAFAAGPTPAPTSVLGGVIAAKPLYRDPVFDAADDSVDGGHPGRVGTVRPGR